MAAAARMQLELRHRSQGWAPPIEEAAELTQRASTALADTNPWRRQVPTIEGAVCRPKVGLRPRRLPPRGTCLVAAEPYLQGCPVFRAAVCPCHQPASAKALNPTWLSPSHPASPPAKRQALVDKRFRADR